MNITRIGDVVLIDLGDGGFTGREPHTSHHYLMKAKTLILPFAALLIVGCTGGGGLNDEQRVAAEVQADQLCQIKQLDPDAYKSSVQLSKMAIGYDDGSKEVAILREVMKLAKEKGCVS
ncbi:hypothetical protein N8463_02800 [Synechococcus sp. AH-601-P06]|nr:hypothetical protein [Synechococcus sp. AH-601-P06]